MTQPDVPSSSRSTSLCPFVDTPTTLLLSESLRRYFRHDLSLRDALVLPAKRLTRQTLNSTAPTSSRPTAPRSTPSMGRDVVADALYLETTSTWLLLEALFDPEFSPTKGRETTAPCSPLWLSSSPEAEHLTRAMSWLQLELRRELYLDERRPSLGQPLLIDRHASVIDVTGPFMEGAHYEMTPNHEPLFEQCLKYTAAGMGSVAADLFVSCHLSHYAAPLYSSLVPPLNLVSTKDRDFYRDCLGDPPKEIQSTQMRERDVDVRAAVKRQRNGAGMPIKTWMDVAERNEMHFGSGTRAVLQNWICDVKADSAARNGKKNEHAFYCLMSGRKRKENVSCPSSWHSSIFVGIYGRLRQLLHQGFHRDAEHTHDLMQLDGALTSTARQQVYRQGFDVLQGRELFERQDDMDLEQTFLAASMAHRTRHPFQEFFRKIQTALILRTQANVLTELKDSLHTLVEEIHRSRQNVSDHQQMWILAAASLLVFLMNRSLLNKKDMTPSELATLDEVLECALELVQKEGEYLLIPLYARHLRAERLTHWFHCALRSFNGKSDEDKRTFYKEGTLWLEKCEELEREGFHRPDDPEGRTLTMVDILLSNLEFMYRDVSFSLQDREAALSWIVVAGEQALKNAEIRQHLRNLLFSFYSETTFMSLKTALQYASMLPFCAEPGERDVLLPPYGEASQEDIERWERYCRLLHACHSFLETAAENGISVHDDGRVDVSDEVGATDAASDASQKEPESSSFVQRGLTVYWEGIDEIIVDEFFFDKLFLPMQVEKHKIEFVVGKGLNERGIIAPFNAEELPEMTDAIEKFVNELLACREDIAAGASVHTPQNGYFTIRVEFKREALSTPLLGLVAAFMKGTREGMPSVAVLQISAPLIIKKHLANMRAKYELFCDLLKVQIILKRTASHIREVQDMEDIFVYILSRRCEVFEEEQVFRPSELTELLKERTNLLIDQYIDSQ